MKVTTVGIDLAKQIFQVHGVDGHGKTVIRRQLRRAQMAEFFTNLPPAWSAWKPVAVHITGLASCRAWGIRCD